mmetsp:Transcript_71021/g.197283  ORF Transcript_71021/g.197283 Transcript_71021/m.197283 type:complete len:259 (-) Transcript_71021:72-848(-)
MMHSHGYDSRGAITRHKWAVGCPQLDHYPFDPRTSTLPIPGVSSGYLASGMNYDYLPRGTSILLPLADPDSLKAASLGEYGSLAKDYADACAKVRGGGGCGAAAGRGNGSGASGPGGKKHGMLEMGVTVRIHNMNHERTVQYNGLVGDVVDTKFHEHGGVSYLVRCPMWDTNEWHCTQDVNDPHMDVPTSLLASRSADANRDKLYPGAPEGHSAYKSEYAALASEFSAATLERTPPYIVLEVPPDRLQKFGHGGPQHK